MFLLWEDPEAGVSLSFVFGRRRYVRQVRRRICSTNKSSVYGERKFCEMSWGKSAKTDDYTKQWASCNILVISDSFWNNELNLCFLYIMTSCRPYSICKEWYTVTVYVSVLCYPASQCLPTCIQSVKYYIYICPYGPHCRQSWINISSLSGIS